MIGSSHTPSQPAFKFNRVELYKHDKKCLETETEVTAHPSGVIVPTGKVTYSIPMNTKVVVAIEGTDTEIPLQIRIPVRARTIGEAWMKFDDEVKANFNLGVQNELERRGLIETVAEKKQP